MSAQVPKLAACARRISVTFLKCWANLAADTADRSDVVALFILIRGDAPPNSIIKDIGHTVAHDERDRGVAFERLDRFTREVEALLTEGKGGIEFGILFEIHETIDERCDLAESLGLTPDRSAIHAASDSLANTTADI